LLKGKSTKIKAKNDTDERKI
jgi:hypothetical protein